MIGQHDEGEVVNRGGREPARQPAHPRIGEFSLAVMVREMVDHERTDGCVEFERRADPAEKPLRDRAARRLVAGTDPAQLAAPLPPSNRPSP